MSGAAAEPGACPAKASARRVASARTMSLLLVGVGRGLNLCGRGGAGRQSVAEREVHDRDLLLLLDDDLLRQPLQALVLAVAQLDERHVDGALVGRDHHAGEVPICIAGEGDVHRPVHARDRTSDHRLEAVRAGGRTVAVRRGASSCNLGSGRNREYGQSEEEAAGGLHRQPLSVSLSRPTRRRAAYPAAEEVVPLLNRGDGAGEQPAQGPPGGGGGEPPTIPHPAVPCRSEGPVAGPEVVAQNSKGNRKSGGVQVI